MTTIAETTTSIAHKTRLLVQWAVSRAEARAGSSVCDVCRSVTDVNEYCSLEDEADSSESDHSGFVHDVHGT